MSVRQKNIVLVIGFLFSLWGSYHFAIKRTLELSSQVAQLEKDKELVENASQRIFGLQRQNKYLDSILKVRELSIGTSFQQTLLQKINILQHQDNFKISGFNQPHRTIENNTMVSTYDFELQADFRTLLDNLNKLEEASLGNLVSVSFEKRRNYRTNRWELYGKFYLQRLTPNQTQNKQ